MITSRLFPSAYVGACILFHNLLAYMTYNLCFTQDTNDNLASKTNTQTHPGYSLKPHVLHAGKRPAPLGCHQTKADVRMPLHSSGQTAK